MDAIGCYARRIAVCLGLSLILGLTLLSQDRENVPDSATQAAKEAVQIQKGTLLHIELVQHVDWKHLATNSVLQGHLILAVFAGDEIVIPEQTKVEMTIKAVNRTAKGSRKWRRAGSAVVRAFNPLEKGRPAEYVIRLSKTQLEMPQGRSVVAATALRTGYAAMIKSRIESSDRGLLPSRSRKGRQTVLLQLDETVSLPKPIVAKTEAAERSSRRKARAFLLTQLSASESRKDDVFQARLAEPVHLGDTFFEAGGLLEGRVSQSTPPRMLSRAGSLYLRIDRIRSNQGKSIDVSGIVGGVEAEAGEKFVLDDEGGLRGLKPGVKNALVDLSIAYAIGKLSDDVAETPIRAVGAAMSDAAVANAARYFGLGASAVFLLTRHGRDVYLPRYSAIEIDFGRSSDEGASVSLVF
jgi:hypothetical protein